VDKKDYLIFTSAGDSVTGFFSWLNVPNNKRIYNTAVVYYGKDDERWEQIQVAADYSWRHEGFVWTSFVEHYEELKDYKHSLILDDDLKLEVSQLNETFNFAKKKNTTGLQYSKDPRSWGVFTVFHQNRGKEYRECNYIEQCFMLIRQDLLEALVDKWKEFALKHVTGVDIVLSNLALQKNMLPFITLDKYKYYNPHPHDKPRGREIAAGYKTADAFKKRVSEFEQVVRQNPGFFKVGPSRWMHPEANLNFPIHINAWDAKEDKSSDSVKKENFFTIIKISDRYRDVLESNLKTLKQWTHLPDVEVFNAKEKPVSSGLKYFGIKNEWGSWPNNRSPLDEEFGAFFSHLYACEYAIKNELPHIVVLEDDALVTKNFNNVVENILQDKNLNYDFISLWDSKPHKPKQNLKTLNKFVQKSYDQRYGAVAMIYSIEGAKKILEHFREKGFYTTYDVALYKASRDGELLGMSYISSVTEIIKHMDKTREKSEIGPLYKRRPLW
jgi:GR25 family glycosyltransferase involved in LPS biosynthesis